MSGEIRTCSRALLVPGACCVAECGAPAAFAVLTGDLTEHAMCESCAGTDDVAVLGVKPLVWAEEWKP